MYCRKGIKLKNFIEGGAQERGLRGGTEAIPGILAMAAALKESCEHLEENAEKGNGHAGQAHRGPEQDPLLPLQRRPGPQGSRHRQLLL